MNIREKLPGGGPPPGMDPAQERSALLFMLEDLERERHQLDQVQREWQAAVDAATDPVFLYDQSYRVIRANQAYIQRAGKDWQDIVGKPYFEVFPKLGHPIFDVAKNSKQGADKSQLQLGSGEVFLSRNFPVYDKAGVYLYSLHVLEDITHSRQAEISVRRTRQALKLSTACMRSMSHASDEWQMLAILCRVIVQSDWYRAAWVGYAEQDKSQSVRQVAFHGHNHDSFKAFDRTWADTEYGQGPVGAAIRSGKTVIAHDVLNDPRLKYWHRDAVLHHYASVIGLPLVDDQERVFGVLCLCVDEPHAFSEEEVAVLEELAASTAFGVTEFRRGDKQNKDLLKRVRYLDAIAGGLESVIAAIGEAGELHNPYATGHQRRVVQIAMAIAAEMNLPENTTRGVHLAATMHDFGETQVPVEILCKTGELTADEFAQIKRHPQFGYEVLRGLNLPWPVAEAVLQHHERLDGSGYPNGLKGEEILLEARIIAVADMIEALAFGQRPNHPRLGIPAALRELEKSQGKLYDVAVIAAALRLFREKGFTVE